MKKFFASILTVVMMISCITVPAMARSDFSDLPSTHWAYADAMKVADAGIIEGTGNNKFSPNMTLGADQFLTMVGRTCYPEDATSQAGDNWATPYIRAAKANGILEGTTITDANVSKGISRYDMAVILTNVGKNVIGATGGAASSSQINDYGEIPAKYTDAVLWAYGNGLLKGDEKDNFNGKATMTRAVAATVISRLMTLQESTPAKPVEPEQPVVPAPGEETEHMNVRGYTKYFDTDSRGYENMTNNPVELSLYYTESGEGKDGILLAKTTSDNTGYYEFDIDVPAKYFSLSLGNKYYISGGTTTYNGKTITTAPNPNYPGVEGNVFSYYGTFAASFGSMSVTFEEFYNL